VHVPAGNSEVVLRFEDTPIRRLGKLLSGLAALTIAALCLFAMLRRFKRSESHDELAGN
jgi:hypothetical protein